MATVMDCTPSGGYSYSKLEWGGYIRGYRAPGLLSDRAQGELTSLAHSPTVLLSFSAPSVNISKWPP